MKFNIFKREVTKVVNHEGANAFRLTPEMELYTAVVTAGLNNNAYETADDRILRIRKLIAQNDPEYVAKLAVYARSDMYLRSVPLVLAVEMAKQLSGNGVVAKTVAGVVKRADEITELLAYYQLCNGRTGTKKLNKLSKQIQKGLAVAFNRFDEYQFAKYNRAGSVKLRDALFLVHPKAKDEARQELFNKIASDKLSVPYTWETELSALGQVSFDSESARKEAVRTKWEELIDSGNLGYMAMLRNLRNMLMSEVSVGHIKKVCLILADKGAVKRSKQLPFRFLSAYREVKNLPSAYAGMVMNAIEDAVLRSAENISGFNEDTKVLIACDVSGSMQQKAVSPKSTVLLFDVGLMLGMLMQSRSKLVVSGMFGDTWKIMNMPSKSVLANVQEYYKREGEVGYATNGHKVIDNLISHKMVMDKILLFTDCQLWDNNHGGASLQRSWSVYKKMAPLAKLYLFDLAGYGNTPVSMLEKDVYIIAGWSDKVFDMLHAIENGESVVAKIKQVQL